MTKILDGEMYIRLKPKMLLQNILRTIDTYFCSSFQDDNSQIYDNNQPQLQRQTEAELSLDEIREREAAIRQLEVGDFTIAGSFSIIFFFLELSRFIVQFLIRS